MKHFSTSPVKKAGVLTSPLSKALVAMIAEAGDQGLCISTMLASEAWIKYGSRLAGESPRHTLLLRLNHIHKQGHIHPAPNFKRGQDSVWFIGAAPKVEAASADDGDPAHVALPRRVNMFGPAYTTSHPPVRPGAMDYAALPSLHMGRRYAFGAIAQGPKP